MNEFFQSAFQGKIVTMYEYFLVGSVLDHSKDGLIEILRGLCDNSETPPIEFTETECSFSFVTQNGTIINLKARCNKTQNPVNQQCWHLRYTGQTDLKEDKSKSSMIRSYIDCVTLNGGNNANLYEYLQSIGFGLDYEATIKGNIFHKGRLKIVLSKIYLPVNNDLQGYTSSNFVEVTCVTPSGQESVSQEVKAFSDLLKSYIKLDKLNTIMDEVNLMKPIGDKK